MTLAKAGLAYTAAQRPKATHSSGPFLSSAVQDRVTLLVRRRRRIAAVLLLRRAKELVLCVERIPANGVAPAAGRAILPLVAWRAYIEEPDWSGSELLCIAGVFAAG